MNKVLTFTFLGLAFVAVLASCGSSKGGHCDAYGQAPAAEQSTELPS